MLWLTKHPRIYYCLKFLWLHLISAWVLAVEETLNENTWNVAIPKNALVLISNIDPEAPSMHSWNLLYFPLQYQSNVICLQNIHARFVTSLAIKVAWNDSFCSCFAPLSRISTYNLPMKQKTRLGCFYIFFLGTHCIRLGECYLDYILVTLLKRAKKKNTTIKIFRPMLINVVWRMDKTSTILIKSTADIHCDNLTTTASLLHETGVRFKYGNVFKRRERINCDMFDDSVHRLKTTWNVFSCFNVRSKSDLNSTIFTVQIHSEHNLMAYALQPNLVCLF